MRKLVRNPQGTRTPIWMGILILLLLAASPRGLGAQDPDERKETPRRRAPQRERVSPPVSHARDGGRAENRSSRQDQPRSQDGREIRDDRSTRNPPSGDQGGEQGDSTSPSVQPGASIPVAPPPLPPSSSWPVYGFEEEITLDCPDVWICPLDAVDDYLAWKLVWQTSIPYHHFAELRALDLSWAEVFDRLDVDFWEPYYALGETDVPDSLMMVDDASMRELVHQDTGGIRLPRFACEDPVVLDEWSTGGSLRRHVNDLTDEDIARRIAEETGWCVGSLMKAREVLGSWSRVARRLSISPLIFEASFGLELQLEWADGRRHIRYPQEEDVRYVAQSQLWPELSSSD
jgi:hypothetical protein